MVKTGRDPREILASLRSKRDNGDGDVPAVEPGEHNLTDIGNAERLVEWHGDDLLYCHEQRTWYVWDGQRWAPDATAEVRRRAKQTVRRIYEEAAGIADTKQREAVANHALRSENERRIAGMIAMAQSEPGIPILPAHLDADPWLYACLNGVVELKTGDRRSHRREDYITRLAHVEYNPTATLALWDEFLKTSTQADADLQRFLQTAVGYSLTGDTSAEKFFFIYGPPGSGKSTFIDAIKGIMGDYARTADFETFLKRSFVGGVREDVAWLVGSRFVSSIEVEEGKRFADGLISLLTGGDDVTTRQLYQRRFEFKPTFKLWLVANRAPAVDGADNAVFRRLLRIPFEHVVPEADRDPALKATLRDDPQARAAVLAWAVQGCLICQRDGFRIPDAVVASTADYRAESDPLADFIAMYCVPGENCVVRAGTLYEAYIEWCEEEKKPKRERFTTTMFGRKIAQLGYVSKGRDTKGRLVYWGIGLKQEHEKFHE